MDELKQRLKKNGVSIDLSSGLCGNIPKENIKYLMPHEGLCFQIARCESDINLIKEIISYGYKDELKYKETLKMVYEDTFIYGVKFADIKKKLKECGKTTMYRFYANSFYKVIDYLKEQRIDVWINKQGSFVMDIDKRYFSNKNYEKTLIKD